MANNHRYLLNIVFKQSDNIFDKQPQPIVELCKTIKEAKQTIKDLGLDNDASVYGYSIYDYVKREFSEKRKTAVDNQFEKYIYIKQLHNTVKKDT